MSVTNPAVSQESERYVALAATHASLLLSVDALPRSLSGAEVESAATPVHDLSGDVLFWRARLGGRKARGYLDVAASPAMGAVLVAASPDAVWEPERLVEQALEVLAKQNDGTQVEVDEVRFVDYSHPKLALQLRREGREVAMLELHTWEVVPPASKRERGAPPADFERWSFLGSLTAKARESRAARYDTAVGELSRLVERLDRDRFTVSVVDTVDILLRTRRRDLHYGTRNSDHQVCYELRGQQTNVWCVAASVQMVLDFYRYEYDQVRVAAELGLGTPSSPTGLPYANDALVVTVLERLSGNALDATMFTTNPFSRFVNEINANRPLVSFVPGHSRTVVGYSETGWLLLTATDRGLTVFDPWPPSSGVVTRWENFDVTTYRRTFTAQVTLA